jgi:hypothetical protein
MFASPLGFGASQDFASQQPTQSPQKQQRQEDKQTCIPATCRLLLDAVGQQADEKDLRLHGQEIANVVLVGVVEELSLGAMLEFTLNDGTGRLKVRHYQSNETEHGIVAGRYVSVVGTPRPSPKLHISAMNLRPVTSADEVSYHTIEVAHVALLMKKGGSRAPAMTPAPGLATQPAASQPDTQMKDVKPDPAPTTTAAPTKNLREAVLEVLQKEGESRAEGVPLAVVSEQVKGSTASEVKAMLQELVADGDAFNTIDDEHFSSV